MTERNEHPKNTNERIAAYRQALKSRRAVVEGHAFRPLDGAVRREVGHGPRDPDNASPRSYASEYDEVVEVSLVLRAKAPIPDLSEHPDFAHGARDRRPRLSRAEIAERFGADRADVARVEQFATDHGLRVVSTSLEKRRVTVAGAAHEVGDVFGIEFEWYDHDHHPHRGYTGEPGLPQELQGVVTAILGMSDRPQGHAQVPGVAVTQDRAVEPLTARQLADLYRFPAEGIGRGESVAILVLGGGYYRDNIERQMASLSLTMPVITDVSVDGRANSPCTLKTLDTFVEWENNGGELSPFTLMGAMWTVEATQDVELIASLAPEAEILIFFAPNTDAGIANALTQILHHAKEPSVLSISWSQPEDMVSQALATTVNDEFCLMGQAGMTIFCAAGDSGSGDGRKVPTVAFPASSPHAIACGGTTLSWDDGQITKETVWNAPRNGLKAASGGGVSVLFDKPSWQDDCEVPPSSTEKGGRGLPDVAADSDPATGCVLQLGSSSILSAGTSASTPTWAALLARVNSARHDPIGYLNPHLYALVSQGKPIVRDITEGGNDINNTSGDRYRARVGWDCCSGLGSPVGRTLFDELIQL